MCVSMYARKSDNQDFFVRVRHPFCRHPARNIFFYNTNVSQWMEIEVSIGTCDWQSNDEIVSLREISKEAEKE